ncbi:hypothetical protein CPB86DRAFT_197730 [Serendipita vermifera]|nr:hypothetical protein CPB86DRAFT_197730 [Serendipita vermifera]
MDPSPTSTMQHNETGPNSPFKEIADEIIELITKHLTQPFTSSHYNRDIQSLSLCDRRLHRIVLPFVYRNIRLFGPRPVYELFQHMTNVPNHAHLVKTILLDCFDNPEYYIEAEREAVDKMDVDRFAKEARGRGLPDSLVSKVTERVHWAVALSLVFLLPNLEGFRINPRCFQREGFSSQFATLFNTQFLRTPLRWIEMWGDTRPRDPLDVEALLPVFLYPSVIQVAARQVEPRLDGDGNNLQVASHEDMVNRYNTSNVDTFELYDSRIDGGTLAKFLRLPRSLKKFVYVDSDEYGSTFWRPEEDFRRALDHISTTVEVLILELNNDAVERAGTWSFNSFKCLLTLSVSYRLLMGQRKDGIVDRLPPLLEILFLRISRRHVPEDEAIIDCFRSIL